MNPFMISAGLNLVGSLLGRRDEGRQARENTDRANAQSHKEAVWASNQNKKASRRANKFNVKQAKIAEKRSDENAAVSRRFNAQEAAKARSFSAREADKVNQLSETRDLRNREWAKEDYEQQRTDLGNQFTDLRAAAEKGGFNPLSVLGSSMVPSMGAGGLSSSSYAAGSPVAASSGFSSPGAVTASVPMTYGAPVAVQPLVSNDAILGSLREFGQEATGINNVARAADQARLDLANIELDRARSGVDLGDYGHNYPQYQGTPGVASMGNTAVPVSNEAHTSPLYPDRGPVQSDPVMNMPIITELDVPGFGTVPGIAPGGDFDLDSALNAGVQAAVQIRLQQALGRPATADDVRVAADVGNNMGFGLIGQFGPMIRTVGNSAVRYYNNLPWSFEANTGAGDRTGVGQQPYSGGF